MTLQIIVSLTLLIGQTIAGGFALQATGAKTPSFSFTGVKYFHRFTKDNQHEYTPAGQEDLKTWTDMMTILFYPNAKDGEALAATANAVLETYKANKAVIVKTDSVPRTREKPAEHLIAVIFGRPEFIEAVFARFRMNKGVGSAVIHSHRIYGNKVGGQMNAWLKTNGPGIETQLMKWDAIPLTLSPK